MNDLIMAEFRNKNWKITWDLCFPKTSVLTIPHEHLPLKQILLFALINRDDIWVHCSDLEVGKVKAGISLDSEGILAPDFSAIRTPTTGSYYAEIVKFYVKPLHRKVK
ncbi:hypothetical protein Fcan01_18857 [Folsomia candida]|uniref:Uncharacterized protein n=1 Tax=Folsomia candida TaxID=158441 RepID=A0A226DPJ3_FOLCA|nr:hypothetical protein Fcan01_18857 [Folsomia candida]